MGLGRTYGAAVVGLTARIVEVQAHVSQGLPQLALVGLADTALAESRVRVRSAITNSGLRWPDKRVTVGLSPAWLPKKGPALDVAIALAILVADGQVPPDSVAGLLAVGELGLDGRIRPVVGALSAALLVAERPLAGRESRMVTGQSDAEQARLVPGIEVSDAQSLRQLVAMLRGEQFEPESLGPDGFIGDDDSSISATSTVASAIGSGDLADVRGQVEAKLGLEVAAAGGHHVVLLGRAGVGKTLLADRFPGLLPELSPQESLEVTSIHQLAGERSAAAGTIRRPLRIAPHHTATRIAIIGGGSADRPSVGAVSLAHHGVLFLDEAAEFDPSVLDGLREPLESGVVTIARAGFRVSLPADCQLFLATNPCPCGRALDPERSTQCRCTPTTRRRYVDRLSGPLLDRMDVRVILSRPTVAQLKGLSGDVVESSAVVAQRVTQAKEQMTKRLAGTGWSTNARVPMSVFDREWPLRPEVAHCLDRNTRWESARGRHRVLATAWTIADLAGRPSPIADDVQTAAMLRNDLDQWSAA